MKQLVISLFVLFLLSRISSGSDAAFHGDGATIFAIGKHHGIRLEREVVKITHSGAAPDAEGRAAPATWTAEATATFFNSAAKAMDVPMGLPNWRTFADSSNGDGKWAISQLTVETDGKQGAVRHEEFKSGPGTRPTTLPGKSPLYYDGGFRWSIQIPARGRVAVRTRYSFGGFSSSGSVEALRNPESPFFVPDSDLFWKRAPSLHGGTAFENSRYRTVAYLVTPGQTWSGLVGETEVAVQMPPRSLPHLLVPQPSGFSVRAGFVRWHFENWKPSRPVRVVEMVPQLSPFQKSACPAFDTLEQALAWIEFAKGSHFDRDSIAAVKNSLLAKYGHRFPEKKWLDYFSVFPWFKPKDGVTVKTLSETDRQILAALEVFERRMAD